MPTLEKLTPNRDLQCFFFEPSAIAALSNTSDSGFTVSGTWRQQFDWTVVEWNRDNVYEHPSFRNLPDGDLSGLTLTYEETRTNCIALDSDLFPTVDWPFLRVWAGDNGSEVIYFVKLYDTAYATPIEGSFVNAHADFSLSGSVTASDYISLSYLGEHFTHQLFFDDTPTTAAQAIVDAINTSPILKADLIGTSTVRVYYTAGASIADSTTGANGNRIGIYSDNSGSGTLVWDSPAKTLSGGASPTKWRITLPFNSVVDRDGGSIPWNKVRKLRWTYAADLQAGSYVRSEFQAVVSNWSVTGSGRTYSVAGPGSSRYENNAAGMVYTGLWSGSQGNYSGGTIQLTQTPGDTVSFTYRASQTHTLYLGTRYTGNGATLGIVVDGVAPAVASPSLLIPGEDVLIRWPVGEYGAGSHTIQVTHDGSPGTDFYFDFLEAAVPSTNIPSFDDKPIMTLATDWDTNHSIALAPERTAWLVDQLGFTGRANHYVGALWFYELVSAGQVYASATIEFSGTPTPSSIVTIDLGKDGQPSDQDAILTKLIHIGDTLETLAFAYAQELNRGYTSVWASASGSVVTVYSRSMGTDGNHLTLAAPDPPAGLTVTVPDHFSGGMDGTWLTDLTTVPRLNRAVRDWTLSYLTALHGYEIDAACAFSMELGNGDPSLTAGIAQRGPLGDPVLLPTPSLQTNFSPTSLAYWQEVYLEMATIQASAGMVPFLQFGEVQWWYFTSDNLPTPVHDYHGMPFYDAYTTSQFLSEHGYALPVFSTNSSNPASFSTEVAFLSGLVGAFTDAVMSFVRTTYSSCRFEVLYPTDVNHTAFDKAVNFPAASWTPSALTVLKTECFGFTFGRNLDNAEESIDFGVAYGFPATQSSHLVGISDPTTAWVKEALTAEGKRLESVVLFALDQFCLVGYGLPLPQLLRRCVELAN